MPFTGPSAGASTSDPTPTPGGGGGHTILDGMGEPLPTRSKVQFFGLEASDGGPDTDTTYVSVPSLPTVQPAGVFRGAWTPSSPAGGYQWAETPWWDMDGSVSFRLQLTTAIPTDGLLLRVYSAAGELLDTVTATYEDLIDYVWEGSYTPADGASAGGIVIFDGSGTTPLRSSGWSMPAEFNVPEPSDPGYQPNDLVTHAGGLFAATGAIGYDGNLEPGTGAAPWTTLIAPPAA